MLRDIAGFFRDLKGLIAEAVRAEIVRRFCRVMADKLREGDNQEAYRQWLNRDQNRFLRECEITDLAVPENLDVEVTELSKFCDLWLKIEQFRTGPDAPWRPITPDMNSIRVTMVNQLQAIARGKTTVDDLTTTETNGSLVEEEDDDAR